MNPMVTKAVNHAMNLSIINHLIISLSQSNHTKPKSERHSAFRKISHLRNRPYPTSWLLIFLTTKWSTFFRSWLTIFPCGRTVTKVSFPLCRPALGTRSISSFRCYRIRMVFMIFFHFNRFFGCLFYSS